MYTPLIFFLINNFLLFFFLFFFSLNLSQDREKRERGAVGCCCSPLMGGMCTAGSITLDDG
jgi:hypothetical protein